MPYLLDGNNLIGSFLGVSRPSEADRQALVAEIAARLRRTRARATIVFDGPAGATSLGPLTVRGAGPGGADAEIVRAVSDSRAPAEMMVVTADRELARRVRDAGGKSCAPGEFFRRFGKREAAGEPRPDSGGVDVEEWMEWFGDEGNRGR
jgi:hypothetical protein